MEIEVEYKDNNGLISRQIHKMSRLAFIKHFGFVGQGYSKNYEKILRSLAMLLHYLYYTKQTDFDKGKFSEPPEIFSDPTEKGQFSTHAGKAIADFLSKRINQSIYTVNYEAAMRKKNIPIIGRRPDLLAFTIDAQFAIEAKGYTGSHGDMNKHKEQSKTGGIPVNYSIACVSYNMYSKVKVKYYDPSNENVEYDYKLLNDLTKEYYKSFIDLLDIKEFEHNAININGEKFTELQMSRKYLEIILNEYIYHSYWGLNIEKLSIILPHQLEMFAENGISKDIKPFFFYHKSENDNIYIDNDRIGLKLI